MGSPAGRKPFLRLFSARWPRGFFSARSGAAVCAIWFLCGLQSDLPASAGPASSEEGVRRSRRDVAAIQLLVNDLKTQLSIPEDVSVAIVAKNPLKVSIACVDGRAGPFEMVFESSFLSVLEPGDLKAVVAHELGHVWIFTHHPFLQTEQLANEIAMRVVSRESLETVYDKVWKRAGIKGDLTGFLGSK